MPKPDPTPPTLGATLRDSALSLSALHPDWEAEIARRVADMEAGRMRFVAANEALAMLAARIEQRRPRNMSVGLGALATIGAATAERYRR